MPANTTPFTGSARSRTNDVSSLPVSAELPIHELPDHTLAVTVLLSPQTIHALPAAFAWVSHTISNTRDVIFSTAAECSGCCVPVSHAVPDHLRVFKSAPASCMPSIISLEFGRAAS